MTSFKSLSHLFAALLTLTVGTCDASSLVISQGNGTDALDLHYYYGGSRFTELAAVIDGTFDSVTVVPDLTDLSSLLKHDRLWVDIRATGPVLTALEIDNVKAFAATGRRVVMCGDRTELWVTSILRVVDGEWGGEGRGIGIGQRFSIPLETVPAITDGVGTISFAGNSHGLAIGGTPLFNPNWVTRWGPNVLTILDLNVLGDWDAPTSEPFVRNVVAWLAVPESNSSDILITGIAAVFCLSLLPSSCRPLPRRSRLRTPVGHRSSRLAVRVHSETDDLRRPI